MVREKGTLTKNELNENGNDEEVRDKYPGEVIDAVPEASEIGVEEGVNFAVLEMTNIKMVVFNPT